MLALHSAQTAGGAQFYIGCAQLKISGSGSGTCGPTIELPGAYNAEDKNIFIPNYYNGFQISTYKAPGGEVATCGGSGGSAPTVPTTPKPSNSTAPVVPSASAVVEVKPTPTASPAAGGAQTPAASPTPVTSAVPAPVPSTGAGNNEPTGTLPTTFTLKTFISWLEGKAGAAAKARRHARAF
jgi:cellulase